jgi:hypothetical protein
MLIFLSLIEAHKWAQLGNLKNIRDSLGHTAAGFSGEAGFSRIKYWREVGEAGFSRIKYYQKCFFTIYVVPV